MTLKRQVKVMENNFRTAYSMVNIKIYNSQTIYFYVSSHPFRYINVSNFLPLRGRSRSRDIIIGYNYRDIIIGYNYRDIIIYLYININIRCQISKCTKVDACIFALGLTVSEILAFQIFDLHMVGQGHRVHFSQWRHSMENVKIYKSIFFIFRYCTICANNCNTFADRQTDRQTDKQTDRQTRSETAKVIVKREMAILPKNYLIFVCGKHQ